MVQKAAFLVKSQKQTVISLQGFALQPMKIMVIPLLGWYLI